MDNNKETPMVSDKEKQRRINISKALLKSQKFHNVKKSTAHRKILSEAIKKHWAENKHPWKGKKFSPEHVENLRKSHIGKQTGKNNPRWKGGNNPGTWRRYVLKRDKYVCKECGITDKRVLTADHIKSKALYSKLRFDVSNGITLCANCHLIKTKADKEISKKISDTAKKHYGKR